MVKDMADNAVVAEAGNEDADSTSGENETEAVTKAISEGLKQGTVSTGKDETVYVFADGTGKVNKITVNDVIKNIGEGSIEDSSGLKDVKNILGDETFEESDGKLVWNSNGKNITYQGTSDKELPVSMKISYELDGKEVEPSELAGASGHIKIKYEFTNNTKTTKKVDGKDKEVVTPFIVASGMMIPADNCSNITVDNGKVLDEGSNSIVVGYAMPGILDCIKNQIEDKNNVLDKVEIPESFTMEADVTDFEQKMCLTVVLPGAFTRDDKKISEDLDLSDVNKKIDDLTEAADKLADGTGKLDDGVSDLKDGADKLKDGSGELKDGADSLKDGTGKVVSGSKELADGTGTLKKGMKSAKDGAKKLSDGSKKVADGSDKIKTNLNTLSEGAAKAESGAKKIADGTGKLKTSCGQLLTGAGSAATGAGDIATGIQTVDSSLAQINAGMTAKEGLVNGAAAVAKGAETAEAGVSKLVASMQGTPASIDAEIDKVLAQVTALAGIKTSEELAATINSIDQAITANEAAAPMATVLTNATGGKITSYATYTKLVQANYSIIALQGVKESMAKNLQGSAADVKALQDGMTALKTGAQGVSAGVNKVADSTSKLEAGTKKLVAGSASLKTGLDTLKGGISQLVTGVGTLDTGAKSLYEGNKSISSGSSVLYKGMVTLDGGIGTLSKGITSLYKGNVKLYNGSVKLDAGVQKLHTGLIALDEGAGKLGKGIGKFDKGVGSLRDGVLKLKDGSSELDDGMNKFNDEGIGKIEDMLGDDLNDVVALIEAIQEEGSNYKNYSGISDGMDGNVKFIYKTDIISKDEEDK